MRDTIEFFALCARSGTLLTSLCAIVLLTVGAWLACRLLAPEVGRMNDDAAWQAPLAAVTAALPGALFVALWIGVALTGLSSACLSIPAGRVVFGALIAAMILALARAAWLAAARATGLRRLIRSSSVPSPRLRTIANACKVRARELQESVSICALAGLVSPVVLVSAGALAALSDDELRAALQHERAHAKRGDQLLAAALSFFVDLLPLPTADLVETYRTARELAADQEAVRATDADALAGALIEFAKAGRAIADAACLAGDRASAMTHRLRALLGKTTPPSRHYRIRRLALALALMAIAGVTFIAPALAGQHAAPCSLEMKAN